MGASHLSARNCSAWFTPDYFTGSPPRQFRGTAAAALLDQPLDGRYKKSGDIVKRGREFLKDTIRGETDFSRTDQSLGVPPPAVEKPCPDGRERISLSSPGEWTGIVDVGLTDAIAERRSRRRYTDDPLTTDEISFLLWATQGVREVRSPAAVFRTVPSAGCRHAFETYLCALNVRDLPAGVYRYLPLEHELCLERAAADLSPRLTEGTLGQPFVGRAAAVFVWTALPRRMEWRYGAASHKVIALDAGHVCQNLYLACAAVGAGTCAVAAYDQELMDRLLQVDGEDEFTVYLAPVGRIGPPREAG
jgi:SagB-type dehydrogenase family enzyme